MFPPNKAPMGVQPSPAPAPQQGGAPAPPQPGPGAAPQQSGLRPAVNVGFNQDVQNILLTRIQQLTPPDAKVLDGILNPQTIPVLTKIFPELKPLFDMLTSGGQPGPIGGQQPPAQAGPTGAASQAAPSAAQPGGQPGQGPSSDEEDEDETDNPLVNNQASSGLVG